MDRDASRPTTWYAPAERASPEAIHRTVAETSQSPVMTAVLQSLGGILIVLDHHRQIVAVNDELLHFLGCTDVGALVGLRPGEALRCVHATDNPDGGCGTGKSCSACGAVVAIVTSQETRGPVDTECLLTARAKGHDEAFAFRVRAAPLAIAGQDLTVVSLQDIRGQKERDALERVFLHDILNTTTALDSERVILPLCEGGEREELEQTLLELVERLALEVTEQRDEIALAAGRFRPTIGPVVVGQFLAMVRRHFADQPVLRERSLDVAAPAPDIVVQTDRVLLRRAIVNMVKNALEATDVGGTVRVWCEAGDDEVAFHVWNAGVMTPEVALRVFQRYFSTKAETGRGLGTYGMKLIAERYLHGHVSFTSSQDEGTVFHLVLPRTVDGQDGGEGLPCD